MTSSHPHRPYVLAVALFLCLLALSLRVSPSVAESGSAGQGVTASGTPTSTPSPTRTRTSTPTSTRVPPVMICQALDRPLTIDGSFDDWSPSGYFHLDRTSAYAVGSAHPGQPVTANMDVQVVHDDAYLYFVFRVTDHYNTPDSPIDQVYKDDSIELGLSGVVIDPSGEMPSHDLDYQYQIRADGFITETVHHQAGLANVQWAVTRKDDLSGYVIELAVPRANLCAAPLLPGMRVLMNFTLNDDDGLNGGNYDERLSWADPATWQSNPRWGRLEMQGILNWQSFKLQEGVNNYSGTSDTFLNRWIPDVPQSQPGGVPGELRIRATTATNMNPLVKFDFTGLPSNAVIVRATLDLYAFAGPETPMNVNVFQVLRNWDEAQATWNRASNAQAWHQPGCLGSFDRADSPISSLRLTAINTHYTFDLTSLADRWQRGLANNFGVVLQSTDEQNVEYSFSSSRSTQTSNRPVLSVRYYLLDPTATPTATQTPTVTITPSATATPTATLTSTPSPTVPPSPTPTVATGSLGVHVCNDVNRDEMCLTGDLPVPGAVIEVRRDGQLVGSQMTDSAGNCEFGALPVGLYQVHETNPQGYVSLNDDDWTVDIVADQRCVLYFLDYMKATPSPSHRLHLPLALKPGA